MQSGVSMAKDRKPEVSTLTEAKSGSKNSEPFEFGPFDMDLTQVVDLADNAGVPLVTQKVRTAPASTDQAKGFNVDMQKLMETIRDFVAKQ